VSAADAPAGRGAGDAALLDWRAPENLRLAAAIVASHQALTARALIPADAGRDALVLAEALYHAPLVVLAHDAAEDPLFIYANRAAQSLWELDWEGFLRLPSQRSAAPAARAERAALLARVRAQGWIGDYRGERVSARGRRFAIERATVWNLPAGDGRAGQAAAFARWTWL
jgi:hypothetical protein